MVHIITTSKFQANFVHILKRDDKKPHVENPVSGAGLNCWHRINNVSRHSTVQYIQYYIVNNCTLYAWRLFVRTFLRYCCCVRPKDKFLWGQKYWGGVIHLRKGVRNFSFSTFFAIFPDFYVILCDFTIFSIFFPDFS